jgi:hypothetical protein
MQAGIIFHRDVDAQNKHGFALVVPETDHEFRPMTDLPAMLERFR